MKKQNWKWFGNAGHLCVSAQCRFHLCTKVGEYLVSTVGEYYQTGATKPDTIGWKRLYETMVLQAGSPCECGCGMPMAAGDELELIGYNSPGDANRGHIEACEKWACAKAPNDPKLSEPAGEQAP